MRRAALPLGRAVSPSLTHRCFRQRCCRSKVFARACASRRQSRPCLLAVLRRTRSALKRAGCGQEIAWPSAPATDVPSTVAAVVGHRRHPDQGCRRCRVRASRRAVAVTGPGIEVRMAYLCLGSPAITALIAAPAIIEIGRRGPCDGLAIHLICHLPGVDKRATRRSSRLLRKAEPQAHRADPGVDAVGPSPRRSARNGLTRITSKPRS